MKERFSLKDALFNAEKVHKVALEIKAAHSDFKQEATYLGKG